MSEWQPIETAPKDGTEIALWRPDWPCPLFAFWDEGLADQPFWHASEDVLSDIMGEIEEPTHWCAFPEPPHDQAPKVGRAAS